MEQLTASELAEWEEYSKIDPIGKWRDDYMQSYMMMMITNLAIGIHSKKGTKLSTIDDFLITWDADAEKEKPQQSVEEMKQALLGLAAAQNKRVSKNNQKLIKK